ncbi:lanthionine synthetase LanC family protein [Streptomyces sp. NPDC003860]
MTAPAPELLQRIAERLADPVPPPADEPWRAQSLAEGAAGIALLHIERARLGLASWKHAHRWITQAVAGEVSAADTTGLFLGAPAVAFLLSTTPPSAEHLYADARATLNRHITELAHRRTDAALERIHHEGPVSFAEYDVFYGLTGIGVPAAVSAAVTGLPATRTPPAASAVTSIPLDRAVTVFFTVNPASFEMPPPMRADRADGAAGTRRRSD